MTSVFDGLKNENMGAQKHQTRMDTGINGDTGSGKLNIVDMCREGKVVRSDKVGQDKK